jgi:hypothetical protein
VTTGLFSIVFFDRVRYCRLFAPHDSTHLLAAPIASACGYLFSVDLLHVESGSILFVEGDADRIETSTDSSSNANANANTKRTQT